MCLDDFKTEPLIPAGLLITSINNHLESVQYVR